MHFKLYFRANGRKQVFPLVGADEEDSNDVMQIGRQKSSRNNPNQYRIYDSNGCGACLSTMGGGGLEPHTAIPMFGIDYNKGGQERQIANTVTTRNTVNGLTNIKQDGTAVCIPVLTPDRAEKRQNGRRMKDNGDEAFTLTSQDIHGVAIGGINYGKSTRFQSGIYEGAARTLTRNEMDNAVALKTKEATECAVPVIWYDKYKCYIAIRKLTPRECWRLQSFTDEEFDKAQFVNSDSQLYKQAGNSVTVNVVYDIAKALGEKTDEK